MSSRSVWIAGKCFFERVEVLGVADARDDVLALGVDQEVAVRLVLAGRRVAGEADTGSRVVVAVAEHHRLHVDCGAEVVADPLPDAIGDGPGAVPAREHRLDGAAKLLHRVLRERLARRLLDDRLVRGAQLLQRRSRELGIVADASRGLRRVEGMLEQRAVDAEHDPPVHRDEPAVRVVGEALVVGAGCEALHALVVEPEVEDRVHHPGHRELGAGTHADEQRVGGVSELAAHLRFQLGDLGGDLAVELGTELAVQPPAR